MNMKKNSLLITAAAAALIAGANLASAQGMHQEGSPPAAEQHEPGAKPSPVEKGKPGPSAMPQAQPKGQPQKAEEGGSKTKPGMSAGESKPVGEEKAPNEKKTGENTQQGEHAKPETAGESPNAKPENKSTTPGAATNAEPKKESTENHGTAGKKTAVNLSTEQRTKIRTVIKNDVHVAPVTNVNFNVSIGTAVPRTEHFYPLPQEVLEVYPEWRGYEFILVRDEIVIVEPDTYEIVYIIS